MLDVNYTHKCETTINNEISEKSQRFRVDYSVFVQKGTMSFGSHDPGSQITGTFAFHNYG